MKDTKTVVTADYDYMGRRVYKKVETVTPDPEGGDDIRTITLYQRYLYRGYLQIATLDLTRSGLNSLWLITWDPTEPVATRPLALQKDGTWYTYGIDLPKNVTEIFSNTGGIRTAYTYTPYGEVTSRGNVTQPIQWSSEYNDTELGMVYYNYRHYNPLDGRWVSRDSIHENGDNNLIDFCKNAPVSRFDILGEIAPGYEFANTISEINRIQEENRVNNATAHRYCDNYSRNLGAKCCKNSEYITDDYIHKAMDMCHNFVDKYSVNSKVIQPVECVAKCLSEAENDHIKIKDCSDRNAARLLKHISCYSSCGFFLFDSYTFLTPKGGLKMGLNDLVPDFFESMKNKALDNIKSVIDSIF